MDDESTLVRLQVIANQLRQSADRAALMLTARTVYQPGEVRDMDKDALADLAAAVAILWADRGR